ncbi:MAG: LapA family protein [Candidatus Aminicenantes bacterium]|nr:LapA family protein [Candidatus Aminicenantes bacterium]
MEKEQKTRPFLSVRDILLILLGALLVIVIFQNIKPHVYQIFFWKVSLSPVLLILVMTIAGFVAGWIASKRCSKNRAEKAEAKAAPPAPPAPPASSAPKPPDSGSLPAA